MGEKEFTNYVFRYNPGQKRKLVVAAHYDSKVFDFEFEAATDSAVPCAMMLDLARVLTELLENSKYSYDDGVELIFVFFDGEEAFRDWTDTDSLYGARHLAQKWVRPRLTAGR